MNPSSISVRNVVAACGFLLSVSAASAAVVVESFESNTLSGWSAATINGSTTTVNTAHASEGTHSAANSFTVAASFGGWTTHALMSIDPRAIMDENATTVTLDVYSDLTNPNGWGFYANSINLILNYEGGWKQIGPVSGALSNGSFQTLTWDLTLPINIPDGNMASIATAITNPLLGYSQLGIVWQVGTWAGDGGNNAPAVYTDNGTQTFAIDRISITSVPEPSAAAALGVMGVLALLRRRRF